MYDTLTHPVCRLICAAQSRRAREDGVEPARDAAGIGILTYAAHTFAGQLGADWAAYLSPFHYYIGGEPLKHGMQWADAGILAGASAVLVAAGTYRFNHRDLNG
ncbi:hypothetical protein ACFV7R_41535 [Streptomyces sp. NPDC059866]|uniref:hypothetical protein n=1 Tax=Streptomyces sp. NPDC059866 TaxID=3346978 RepID=UPI003657BDCE